MEWEQHQKGREWTDMAHDQSYVEQTAREVGREGFSTNLQLLVIHTFRISLPWLSFLLLFSLSLSLSNLPHYLSLPISTNIYLFLPSLKYSKLIACYIGKECWHKRWWSCCVWSGDVVIANMKQQEGEQRQKYWQRQRVWVGTNVFLDFFFAVPSEKWSEEVSN